MHVSDRVETLLSSSYLFYKLCVSVALHLDEIMFSLFLHVLVMHSRGWKGTFSKHAQSAKLESPVADRKPAKLTGREARFHRCKREFRNAESRGGREHERGGAEVASTASKMKTGSLRRVSVRKTQWLVGNL